MKSNELLEQVTCPRGGDIDALIRCARARAVHRSILRNAGRTVLALALILAGLDLLLRPDQQPTPTLTTPHHPTPILSSEELLDSFGDQPVALVTYPDGSQRLISIVRH